MALMRACMPYILFHIVGLPTVSSVTRTFFIGIREEIWNFAPDGKSLVDGTSLNESRHVWKFKKALYTQYTDASYTEEVPKAPWLGSLGPVIRAEVDDVIIVHLNNSASRPYSIHPHGLFYKKDSEGALYPDNTSAELKADDGVPPGQSHTYTWIVQSDFAPTTDDAPCISWAYHSHVDAPRDIASGLIGPILTCRKGVLHEAEGDVKRSDVAAEFFLLFSVTDEDLSWYHEGEEDDGHSLHSINGRVFGSLAGLSVCEGDHVAWHIMGMGNEVDIHSIFFHGNTLLERGHFRDVISAFPATFTTTTMVPTATGKWLIACQVTEHSQGGMQAFYEVTSCGHKPSAAKEKGPVRNYYISAQEEEWDYGPQGRDLFTGQLLTHPGSNSQLYFGQGGGALGGRYMKVRFIGHTDDTFSTRLPHHEHLGILGPVISAEVGDTVVVTFFNNASRNYSLQAHGLQYTKQHEGTPYWDGVEKGGASVAPGKRWTYQWTALSGPGQSDPNCQAFLYYSAHNAVADTNSGLVGVLKLCKKGTLDERGKERDVQSEFFLLFGTFDENLSWYLEENIHRYGDPSSTDKNDEEFRESNKMHGVNGLLYGNLPGLKMCVKERVVWHTLGLGDSLDIHGVYFQGNVFHRHGNTRDTLNLFPHTSSTVTMTTRKAGVFSISCLNSDHFLAGMKHQYMVESCGSTHTDTHTHSQSPTVEYFLAAVEVEWDYAPSRDWELQKHNSTAEDSYGNVFLGLVGEHGERRIGSCYKKVVFRQYSDASFQHPVERGAEDTHLGLMGPLLRIEVGEQVSVTFKNQAQRHYSLHAHGVQSEDGIGEGSQSGVSPGEIRKYVWSVTEEEGPGPSDPPCLPFVYYSREDYSRDLSSGLIGPLVVCRHGVLGAERGRRGDVKREFALLFMVFDENESWYLQENIEKHLPADTPVDTADPDFMESNKMHSINGRLYGTLPGLEMDAGDETVWYLMTLGSGVDTHTVHFHAHTFTYQEAHSHRGDVFPLFPGTFQSVSLVAKHPGTWLLHCHVDDHVHAGMEATYTIKTSDNTTGTNRIEVRIPIIVAVCLFAVGLVVTTILIIRHKCRPPNPPIRNENELQPLQQGSTGPESPALQDQLPQTI